MEERTDKKESEPHHKTYVVTHDLEPKITSFRNIGLNTPNPNEMEFRRFLADSRDGIIRIINKAFKNSHTNVRSITMSDLAEEILVKSMKQHKSLKNAAIISTCAEIASLHHGYTLEINRIVNRQGKIIGLGPRPGYPSINEQIKSIACVTSGMQLILAEDGAFSGKTMVHLLERFKEQRMDVVAIVIGFGFPEALENIRTLFDGEITVVEHIDDFVDWMPDHDFFPFLPNCGRVLGIPWNDSALPLYTHNGASYSIPYIQPFCPINDWTSIHQEQYYELSCFCIDQTRKLFEMLDGLNNRKLTIGELIYSRPRVSIPMSIGQSTEPDFPRLDTEISNYLTELRQNLS